MITSTTNAPRSKADFRELRERVGLTQKALANRLGNSLEVTKRWENPSYDYGPPEDAWSLLDRLLDDQRQAVKTTLERVDKMISDTGKEPDNIDLLYYRSQHQYDSFGRDKGDFSIVNARSREVGVALEARGYHVRFLYPEEMDEREYTQLASTRG